MTPKMMDDTTFTPPNFCLSCGYFFDAASPIDNPGAKPTEDDVTVCLNCGEAFAFNANLTVRPMTAKDWADCTPKVRATLALAKTYCSRSMGQDLSKRGSRA